MCTCAVAEARPRDHEMPPVRLQVGVDLRELDVREVVRLDRVRELRVELLDLRRAPPAPARASTRSTGRPSPGRRRARGTRREPRVPLREEGPVACEERHAPSQPPVERPADGGVTGHKSGSLAAPADVCTTNRRENICKQPRLLWYGPRPCAAACAIPRAVRGDRPPGMRRSDVGRRARSGRPARNAHTPRSARRSSSSTPPSRRSRGRARPPCSSNAGGSALDARLARTRRHVAVVRSSLDATNAAGRQPAATALRRGRRRPDRGPASARARCRRCSTGSTSSSARRARTAARGRARAPARAALRVAAPAGSGQARAALADRERRAEAAVADARATRRSARGRCRRREHRTQSRCDAALVSRRIERSRRSRGAPPRRASTPASSAPALRPAPRRSCRARTPRGTADGTVAAPPGTRTLVVDAVAYHLPGQDGERACRSASA